MIALLQRVSSAQVSVEGEEVGAIGPGILALIGVERGDGPTQVKRLLQRILAYRMFSDEQGKMNLNVKQAGGELLLVSQFTLAADTNSGNRPSFTSAAAPEDGRYYFEMLHQLAKEALGNVPTGVFGAYMQVSLVNDGPVTFRLRVKPESTGS